MRQVRWGIVTVISALALVMKAPIWYLLARVSEITGGDGWHRSNLIDISFKHLGLWWFAGMNLKETADWFPDGVLVTTGVADITNQFLYFGFSGGLGAVILFVILLSRAYSGLGKALAAVRLTSSKTIETEFILWGLGVMLLVHIVNWFDITYFDQMYVIWFLQLAAISSLSLSCAGEVQSEINKSESLLGEESCCSNKVQAEPETAVIECNGPSLTPMA